MVSVYTDRLQNSPDPFPGFRHKWSIFLLYRLDSELINPPISAHPGKPVFWWAHDGHLAYVSLIQKSLTLREVSCKRFVRLKGR